MKNVPLIGPNGKGLVATVDDADFPLVSQYRWFYHSGGSDPAKRPPVYARGYRIGGDYSRRVLMHRLILGVPSGTSIDHKNGDGLDNRRSNIRACTQKQNSENRTRDHNQKFAAMTRQQGPLLKISVALGREDYMKLMERALAGKRSLASYVRRLILADLARRAIAGNSRQVDLRDAISG